MATRQHAAGRLLTDHEGPEGRDHQRAAHVGGVEVDKRSAGAKTCVVQDHIRRGPAHIEIVEHARYVCRRRSIGPHDPGAETLSIRAQRRRRIAADQHDRVMPRRQQARERHADAGARPHDQR